ncbi:YIP1 family protein [Nocardiopsis sp. HNM0947]|uniref:YIP1 family protein n=1 Tax=Nocardiopsis coralli TaxID=2772213 RepID=A0ABR9P646_9ACTN|nr:YIP1 family protein [Nocardiopsis coralli]MBE2999318.1 YIP1 family protein [Nocardiopsis coralli]
MLRHLVGLLIGAALAPALWGAVSWSAEQLPQLAGGTVSFATVSAAVLLAAVGAVGAGLVATRVSPLIAATGGLLLAAIALWPAVAPQSMGPALGWLNQESFLYPSGPGLAVALPLGVLLFGSALTPTRWHALYVVPGGAAATGDDRGRYRSAPVEEPAAPDLYGPAGDTVPEHRPPPPPPPPPRGSGLQGDPDKTTTPFRRGEDGASWSPLEDEAGRSRAHGDDPV